MINILIKYLNHPCISLWLHALSFFSRFGLCSFWGRMKRDLWIFYFGWFLFVFFSTSQVIRYFFTQPNRKCIKKYSDKREKHIRDHILTLNWYENRKFSRANSIVFRLIRENLLNDFNDFYGFWKCQNLIKSKFNLSLTLFPFFSSSSSSSSSHHNITHFLNHFIWWFVMMWVWYEKIIRVCTCLPFFSSKLIVHLFWCTSLSIVICECVLTKYVVNISMHVSQLRIKEDTRKREESFWKRSHYTLVRCDPYIYMYNKTI